MVDDITFASRYALLGQGLLSMLFALIGFYQGQPYMSNEVAQFYFLYPLELAVITLLFGIITSFLTHYRKEKIAQKFPQNIGEFLLLYGLAYLAIVAFTQADPVWFTPVLFIPSGLALLFSIILLLRTNYMNVISSYTDFSYTARNIGITIFVCTLLLDIGGFYGYITGLLSRSTMVAFYFLGILFIALAYLIRHYRSEYALQQSRLSEQYSNS